MNKTEILNRLDKLKFYQALVPSLKVNGKPEALGLCAFHDDHNPSLSVNIETGLYHCPVCSAGGDVFTFYQKIMGVDFPTALKEIGTMAGVVDTSVKGKVMVSHYANVLYDDLYTGWRRFEYSSFKGSHKSECEEKPKTTEVLYCNFKPVGQNRSLFQGMNL